MNGINRRTVILYLKIALWVPVILGWWGFFYPDIALNADTYEVVSESGEVVEGTDCAEDYVKLLSAKPGQIRLKSRLFQLLFQGEKGPGRASE